MTLDVRAILLFVMVVTLLVGAIIIGLAYLLEPKDKYECSIQKLIFLFAALDMGMGLYVMYVFKNIPILN
jgi:Na+-transporting NADH:ubiquinone oxidoreductase subunit NqrC